MSALWAVALIMLCSGVAKLRTHDDVAATFTRLKVPRPFNAAWLARAFPYLEIALAVGLVQPFTALRAAATAVAVVLFVAFLVLVVRAKGSGVSCGCFGEASAAPISGQTVVRNVLFLLLALLAFIEAVSGVAQLGAGVAWLPLAALGPAAWSWTLVVALLLAGSAYLVGREAVPAAAAATELAPAMSPSPPTAAGAGTPPAAASAGASVEDEAEGDEPLRHPFPDSLILREGQFDGLHRLAQEGAVVALRLSIGCGSCSAVIARLPEFAQSLGPVRVRVLMPQFAADMPVRTGQIPTDLVLADPAGQASTALGLTSFPSAVLLGTDLLTAGGPVFGADAVLDFLAEIREVIAAELPAGAPGGDTAPAAPTHPADLPQESRP